MYTVTFIQGRENSPTKTYTLTTKLHRQM